MAYIGNTATTQAFTPAVDYFNGDGSTVAFTLSKPVASVAQVQAVIENVPQNPGSAYTVSGNTITFTSAPPSGTANIYVYYTSPITQVIAPSQGTVSANQIASNYALWNKSGSDINYTTGNAGVGVVPGSWDSAFKTTQVGLAASFSGQTGAKTAEIASNAYYNSGWKYLTSDYASHYYQYNGAHVFETAGSGTAGNATNFVERVRIDSDGIKFNSDTAAANALDDYEEGDWTPTIKFGGGSTGITYSGNTSGRYTKIGRIVTVAFFVELTNKGSSSGDLTVQNLPFTPYSAGQTRPYYAGIFVGEGNLASMPTGTYMLGWSDGNFYIRYNGTSGLLPLSSGNINNNSSFYGNITYEVA